MGASGYLINSALFWALDHIVAYPIAFAFAFVGAATSNFVLNRLWTFRNADRAVRRQYARFITVSCAALAIDLLMLTVLVELAGMPKLAAAGLAIVAATPASFAGNRLWTFRRHSAPPLLSPCA